MENRKGEYRNPGRSRHVVTTAIAASAALLFAAAPAGAEDAYVRTDGSNYIITDYYPSCVAGAMTVIDVDFQLDSTSNVSQPRIFAVYNKPETALSMALYVNNGKNFAFSCKDGEISGATVFAVADTARHRFTYNSKTGEAVLYNADGTAFKRAIVNQTRSTKANEPLRLFCQSSWMSATKAQGRLYGLKIGEADASGNIEEKHDFSPVVRDGVPGILDSLTGKFFSASGPAALTSGGDIESVASGDAYLESDGAAYINTGYFPTRKTRIEADFSMVETNNVTQPRICGSNGLRYTLYINSNGFFAYNAFDYAAGLTNKVAGYQWSTGVGRDIGVRHVFSVDKAGNQAAFYTGSATNYSATMATTLETEKATGALYVFNGADWSQLSKIRLYRLNIYEDGALERSYVPYVKNGTLGLYDTTGGNFHPYESGTYGGAIGHDNCDAYLKSDGTQAIVTDYTPNPDTRIEVDFKLNSTDNVSQPRIFASRAASSDSLSCVLYVNNAKNFAFSLNDGDVSGIPMTAADTGRHTFILDSPADKALLVTGTTTNAYDITATRTKTGQTPLWVFAQSNWLLGTKAMADLYSLRIYEKKDGEYGLVREYLPWASGGVGGLYETRTGTVLTNTLSGASAFAIGGMGTGGAGSGALLVKPQDTRVSGTRPTLLSAYAPGAVAYRWTRGGEALSGETGATLAVERIEGAQEIVYGVTPIFDVFGETIEGETATCVVDHGLLPFVIVVR